MQREKAHPVKSRGNQVKASKSALAETQRTYLSPLAMNCDNVCEVLFTTEAHQRLSAQDTYQNCRLSKGKHVFSINYTIYRNNLGTVRHPYHIRSIYKYTELFTSQVPRQQNGSTLQTGPSKNSSLRTAMLTVFCTSSI